MVATTTTEADIDTLASTKGLGDLPADAVVKRSVATADDWRFCGEALAAGTGADCVESTSRCTSER